MRKGYDKKREEALRMRIERLSFKEISRKLKVSPRTLSRWENGWIDKEGRQHLGWKEKLEQAWEDLEQSELQYGLLLKKERLKTYEQLARMAVNKLQESFPAVQARHASDIKALLSELRELCRLIREETGEHESRSPTINVRADISLGELQERYHAAHAAAGVTDVPKLVAPIDLPQDGTAGPDTGDPDELVDD